MLTLILGPSGSGKSVRLREELRQRARSRQRSILIVPEQFTSSTEGALYHALGDELSAYVESYSFTSLAETLLRRYGGAAVPTLSEAGRAVLVRRAMDEMMDKVVYYSRQRRSAAFCQKAAETISELKSAGIRPETLADYANAPGADKDKLGELALIFGTYETLLAQTAMDPGDRVELAAKSLDQAFFAGRTVYIDEFDTFNHSKRAMLAAMLPVADVTVSLCCDQAPDQADDGVFSGARRVANTLKSMAASAGVPCKEIRLTQDMRHKDAPVLAELGLLLADPTYTPEAEVDPAAPAITYYKADSRQAEAKAVAAAVKARARAGVPYNKMAVICRTVDQYLLQIRYKFRLQNIPLFCDEPTTPKTPPRPVRIHAALDLLRGGLTTTALLRLLKTGLVDLDRTASAHWKTMPIPGRYMRRTGGNPLPATRRATRPDERAEPAGPAARRGSPQLFGAAGTEIYGPCPQCGYRHPDGANLLLFAKPGGGGGPAEADRWPACMRGPAQRGRSPAGMECDHRAAGPDGAPAARRGAHHPS